MARQASTGGDPAAPDFAAWIASYIASYEEESRFYPTFLLARLEEPLRAHERVSLEAIPLPDQYHRVIARFPERARDTGYLMPLMLLNEVLTAETAAQLTTALAVVRSVQGVDADEALAFMVQLYLVGVDYRRAARGLRAVFPTLGQLDRELLVDYQRRPVQERRPVFRLKHLLNFWHLVGARHAGGFVRKPPGGLGRAGYQTFPPVWLSWEELKLLQADRAEAPKVPLLVDPVYVPLAEHFLAEHYRIDRDLSLPSIAPGRTDDGRSVAVTAQENSFQRQGEVWAITYAGVTIHLKDSKGLQYLSSLLRQPGREVHALELARGVGAVESSKGATAYRGLNVDQLVEQQLSVTGLGDAGPQLDEQAKAEYRRRLCDLEENLQDAEVLGDDEGADKIREEREAILQELKSAVGLGGRDRLAASARERARVNITKHVKAAIGKINQELPDLGRHLRAAIQTGTYCSYHPESPVRWRC